MDNERNPRRFESVFSKKVRAGKRRTYFFDVRRTKGDDYYLTLTESTKNFDTDGYQRHKIFLYKEDFNRFLSGLNEAVDHVKHELMPDYDYDEYTRRHEEWEAQRLAENEAAAAAEASGETATETTDATESADLTEEVDTKTNEVSDDDDISW